MADVTVDGRSFSDRDEEALTGCGREYLPAALLLAVGSLAFVHLTALPAFEDEGSQLGWIMRIIQEGEWLRPLGDGKPLEAWPMVALIRLGAPPLAAMRSLHVLAGIAASLLTYRLAFLTDRSTALATGVLFAACPFVVYLQRLALSDMFLCAAGAWTLVSLYAYLERPTWHHAAAYGTALAVSAFAKMPVGFIFLCAAPSALLAMPATQRRRLLEWDSLRKLLGAQVLAAIVASVTLLIAVGRARHGLAPGFGLQDLLGIGLGHYPDIAAALGVPRPRLLTELAAQLSWPVTGIAAVGLVGAAIYGDWRGRWLLACGLLPLLAIGLLTTFWFSRYVLFTLPPLCVCAVSGWHSLANHMGPLRLPVAAALFGVCAACMGLQSAWLVIAPVQARWSAVDRVQYLTGPGSGYGYPEAARFIENSPAPPAIVYSLDGHSAYQLLAYLPFAWRDRVAPVYDGPDHRVLGSSEARRANLLSHRSTWLIVPQPLLAREWTMSFGGDYSEHRDLGVTLRQLAAFDKPGVPGQLTLYEVTP